MTVVSLNRYRHHLAAAAAPLALLMAAPAVAQQQAGPERRASFVEHSWQAESSFFYTDNFRRLSDEAVRFDFTGPVFANGQILTPNPVQTSVQIETPDNSILSGTIRGSTLIRRPIFAGLLSGSVTVGTFLNSDDLEQRLLASATPQAGETAFFDVPGEDDPVELPVTGSAFGLPSRTETFVDPNIRATGTLQLAENLLYLDANALVQEQNIGFAGFGAQEGVGQSGDQVTYGGFSVSPYLLHRFANESSVELRVRATAIEVLDEDVDLSNTPGLTEEQIASGDDVQIENDGRSVEALAEYQSGDLFDRVSFKLGAFYREVTEDGSDIARNREVDFNQGSGSFDLAYGINRVFSLTAGVGVDEIDFAELEPLSDENPDGATTQEIDALDRARELRLGEIADQAVREDELSGMFWRVGFQYVPTRRSKLSVSVGERYGDTSVEVDGQYRPSPRLTVNLRALRTLDSGLQDFVGSAFQLQGQAFNILSSLAGGQSQTSSALLERALSFEGSSFRDAQRGQFGLSAFNRVRLGVRADFQRTNFSAGVSMSDTEDGFRQSEVLSADASLSRQISRKLTGSVRLRYSLDDGEFFTNDIIDGETATLVEPFESEEKYVSADLAYRIGNRAAVTFQVYRVERDSDGRSRGTQLDYVENAAGLGLRWAF